jgi:hypothetical protein
VEQAKDEISGYLEEIRQLKQVEQAYMALKEEMRVTANKLKEIEEQLRKEKAKNQ